MGTGRARDPCHDTGPGDASRTQCSNQTVRKAHPTNIHRTTTHSGSFISSLLLLHASPLATTGVPHKTEDTLGDWIHVYPPHTVHILMWNDSSLHWMPPFKTRANPEKQNEILAPVLLGEARKKRSFPSSEIAYVSREDQRVLLTKRPRGKKNKKNKSLFGLI